MASVVASAVGRSEDEVIDVLDEYLTVEDDREDGLVRDIGFVDVDLGGGDRRSFAAYQFVSEEVRAGSEQLLTEEERADLATRFEEAMTAWLTTNASGIRLGESNQDQAPGGELDIKRGLLGMPVLDPGDLAGITPAGSVDALLELGWILQGRGAPPAEVLVVFEQAEQAAHAAGLTEHLVAALLGESEMLILLGELPGAAERADQSLQLSGPLPARIRAAAYHQRARVLDASGSLGAARQDLLEALALDQERAPSWILLAQLATSEARWDEARSAFIQGVDVALRAGELRAAAQGLWEIANLERVEGRRSEARSALERSIAYARRAEDVTGEAFASVDLGWHQLEEADLQAARMNLERGRELASTIGDAHLAQRAEAGLHTIDDQFPPTPKEDVPRGFDVVEALDSRPDARVTISVKSGDEGERVRVRLASTNGETLLDYENPFTFTFDAIVHERLRWYLEDAPQRSDDVSIKNARRMEEELRVIGAELSEAVFAHHLGELRASMLVPRTAVEVVTDGPEADALPWELMLEPGGHVPIALAAHSFVRTPATALEPVDVPSASDGVRILLAICRPAGIADLPFRSVATSVLRALDRHEARFRVDVARPPTFEHLVQMLTNARSEGRPYHVVHFDGHGIYDEEKRRSFLNFEQATTASKPGEIRVTGKLLGEALVAAGTPLLVLNACRSAYVRSPSEPLRPHAPGGGQPFGTLASEALATGVRGVLAMRYNVYVETAARLMLDVYAGFAAGLDVASAVRTARTHLAQPPDRARLSRAKGVADWCVPVLYESVPTALDETPTTPRQTPLVGLDAPDGPVLPERPRAGFVGRDEVLLELEKAFAQQSVILLRAYAGAGKSATAVEFGRWFKRTGGCEGPLMFSSFRSYVPLSALFEHVAHVYSARLREKDIDWKLLSPDQRRSLVLDLLAEQPGIWIWDDVEWIGGFPKYGESPWTPAEQAQLTQFISDAVSTGSRFLLVSRRPDESRWLGELAGVVMMPNMPWEEREQLVDALARLTGVSVDVSEWGPILAFSEGNPLTLQCLAERALTLENRSSDALERFLGESLTPGVSSPADWTASLAASVLRGLEVFDDAERAQLSLLTLFSGYVTVLTYCLLGQVTSGLPEVEGKTPEEVASLFDRAREVGLLTRVQGGVYAIHPALHLLLPVETETLERRLRAFVEAMAETGTFGLSAEGEDSLVHWDAEDANLQRAFTVAVRRGWSDLLERLLPPLQRQLLETGRAEQFERYVQDATNAFGTDVPQPGIEAGWVFVNDALGEMARRRSDPKSAERHDRMTLAYRRARAEGIVPSGANTPAERDALRSLAVGLNNLGQSLIQRQRLEARRCLVEAACLSRRIGDSRLEALVRLNLGTAYMTIGGLRSLDRAHLQFSQAIAKTTSGDRGLRAKLRTELGTVEYERALAGEQGLAPEEFRSRLERAKEHFVGALNLVPPYASGSRAVLHNQLGQILRRLGRIDECRAHFARSIELEELDGTVANAVRSRLNLAYALDEAEFKSEALAYAVSARRELRAAGIDDPELAPAAEASIARLSRSTG